jgi:hypothetical protein
MMWGEADADGLTAAAVGLLEAEVAPNLAGEARFKALMAIAALRMAERERRLGVRLAEAETNIIRAGKMTSLEALRTKLRNDSWALAGALHQALLDDAVLRAAVTKPGALTAEERSRLGLD